MHTTIVNMTRCRPLQKHQTNARGRCCRCQEGLNDLHVSSEYDRTMIGADLYILFSDGALFKYLS